MVEPPLLFAGAIVALLWLAILIRGSWVAARNYELFVFFLAMSGMSGWLVAGLPWAAGIYLFVLAGFAVAMAIGAVTSLVALVRENPLG